MISLNLSQNKVYRRRVLSSISFCVNIQVANFPAIPEAELI